MTAVKKQSTKTVPVLHVAFELGWGKWKLACGTQAADNPRLRTVSGRDRNAVLREIAAAKAKFRLPANAPVVCCYEAGRDGHWLQRYLSGQGLTCHEVDSSSIEVNRRQRRAKSDRLDAGKLLSMLIRYENGERNVWRVVNVPSPEAEAQRHLHRELDDWQDQRRQHSNRIKGLLATLGHEVILDEDFPRQLQALRDWSGSAVPEELRGRLLRQYEGWKFADRMVKELESQRAQAIHRGSDPSLGRVRQLLMLKGVGAASAWLFVREVFGWRQIKNRREMGSTRRGISRPTVPRGHPAPVDSHTGAAFPPHSDAGVMPQKTQAPPFHSLIVPSTTLPTRTAISSSASRKLTRL
jgi:transposase